MKTPTIDEFNDRKIEAEDAKRATLKSLSVMRFNELLLVKRHPGLKELYLVYQGLLPKELRKHIPAIFPNIPKNHYSWEVEGKRIFKEEKMINEITDPALIEAKAQYKLMLRLMN